MPKASEIAQQLRKVADLLDTSPDSEIKKPSLSWHVYTREEFMAAMPFIPRPAVKRTDCDSSFPYFYLEQITDAMSVYVAAPQSATCVLVTPARAAVYDCLPLLSPDDEDVLV